MTPLHQQRVVSIEHAARKRREDLEARLRRQRRANAHAAKSEEAKRIERWERAFEHGRASGLKWGGEPPPLDDPNDWNRAYDSGYRAGAAAKAEEDANPKDETPDDEPLADPPDFEQSILAKLLKDESE